MRLFFKKEQSLFYYAYFFVVFVYLAMLRLNGMPMALTYGGYGVCIVLTLLLLLSKGLNAEKIKIDVLLLCFFMCYYFVSSVVYVAFSSSVTTMEWIFKDWSYSLLPPIYYVLIRSTKFNINKDGFLKLNLYGIVILDIVSLILFLFPSSSFSRMFNQEMIKGDAYAYALNGIAGVIVTGFLNVLGLSICLLSSIQIKQPIKIAISVLFIICAYLTGQRTPLGGIVLVLIFLLYKYKFKGVFVLAILIGIFSAIIGRVTLKVDNVSVIDNMTERTKGRFNSVKEGDSGRDDQYYVSDEFAFGPFIGEGVGKFSPENPESKHSMQDAMIFRLYNEMGMAGLVPFILFFFVIFERARKDKNGFMMAVILYIFIANYFNRVLFVAPISILPYSLLAMMNWDKQISYS